MFGLLVSSLLARSASASDTASVDHRQGLQEFQMQFMDRVDLRRIGCDAGVSRSLGSSRVSYQISALSVYWIRRQETMRFSFALPINLLSIALADLTDKAIFHGRSKDDPMNSPAILWLVPNSSLRWKPVSTLQLVAGLSTDYLFLRINGANRGILCGQYIGLSIGASTKGPDPTTYLLGIRMIHNNFVDFEGPDHDEGWSFCASFNMSAKLIWTEF